MRRVVFYIFVILCVANNVCRAQHFSFAQISDTHIGKNKKTITDLQNAINQINTIDSVKFVVITGDIVHKGDTAYLDTTKKILDQLSVPYYIIPGNQETRYNNYCMSAYKQVFGDDRFVFEYDSCLFLGINSGTARKSEGHLADSTIQWSEKYLRKRQLYKYAFLFAHHPMQEGDVDNFEKAVELVERYDITCLLGGHYHRNIIFECGGRPDILTRTIMSDEKTKAGFSLVTISNDRLTIEEYRTDSTRNTWLDMPLFFEQ